MSESPKPFLGYVACLSMPDGAFFGGVLITDVVGLPIEFRHTDPVAPSRLQRVLYGRSLESYMFNEVVLGALLTAVEAKPLMYVVGDVAYMAGADGYGPPAIWLAEARNVPAKEVGVRHDLSDEEYVLQLGPGNGPVRVRISPREDFPPAGQRELSTKMLNEASQQMELLEPLRRIEEALKLVWEEGQKSAG